jgi:trk system potassium uptake protein TrkA
MIACQVAHSLFEVPMKIARVRHRDYLNSEWQSLYSTAHLPIDVIISPEMEVAETILRRLHVPGALDMIPFDDDIMRVVTVRCEEDCPMNNLPLNIVASRLQELNVRIIGVSHDHKFSLSTSDIILKSDDMVYIACDTNDMQHVMSLFGHDETEARRIVILGGGNVGHYVARALESEQQYTRVKVVELDKERAEMIAQELNNTTVIHGSGLDKDILAECGIDTVETIIAVTNDDKVNILAALLAKRYGCKRSISLVNNNAYIPLLGNLGVDVIVNPRESTVSSILQHVRRGKIRSIHSVHDGSAEIIEVDVVTGSIFIGKRPEGLTLPNGVKFVAIIREQKVMISDHDTVIQQHDHVIIICMTEAVKKLEKYLSERLELF